MSFARRGCARLFTQQPNDCALTPRSRSLVSGTSDLHMTVFCQQTSHGRVYFEECNNRDVCIFALNPTRVLWEHTLIEPMYKLKKIKYVNSQTIN